MKVAILSDIHANWEALQAAAEDADSRSVGEYYVLGDTVGYGANPNECLNWVFENASVSLMGNHEKAVLDSDLRDKFNPYAREAIDWTAKELDLKYVKEIPLLPYTKEYRDLTIAHASLHDPEEFPYIFTYEDAESTFDKMKTDICFVGHTHVPCMFCELQRSAENLSPGKFPLQKGSRYILNPGSVGQPRDFDSRLSYGVFDTENYLFEIVRLEYDKQKAATKIRKAGLPAFLADRLL